MLEAIYWKGTNKRNVQLFHLIRVGLVWRHYIYIKLVYISLFVSSCENCRQRKSTHIYRSVAVLYKPHSFAHFGFINDATENWKKTGKPKFKRAQSIASSWKNLAAGSILGNQYHSSIFWNAGANFLEYFRPSHAATKSTLFRTITCSYLRLTTSNRIDMQLD